MVHDPRRQTTRPTTVTKGGKRINVAPTRTGGGGGKTGSLFGFGTRLFEALTGRQQTGNPIELALSQLLGGQDADGLEGLDLGGVDLFGDGGGGGDGSFGGSRAGAELSNQFALEQLLKEQQFASAEAEKARLFEREQETERLKAERERIFTDMLGTDPVRAVLFALGVGGEILPGGERFANLQPLQGAQQQATNTAQALSQLVGRGVDVGQQGVTGLGSAAQSAAAFGGQAGGAGGNVADQQRLLLSGFGVGAKRGQGRPGQSREETLRQIASVTPQGTL